MTELTVISTCYREADRPVVKIGLSTRKKQSSL